jgi:hypothetical protein
MDPFNLIGAISDDQGATDALARRAKRIMPFVKSHQAFASSYVAGESLETAINVALSLGRPLLLTGEPGSGKTLAAYWIAYKLGLIGKHMQEFHVKSDSRARDLCYQFDAVSWYRESQLAASRGDPKPIPKDSFLAPGPLGLAFGWKDPIPSKPSVLLIDEIDKAPRDFPNDLLLELDQMKFTIAETNEEIVCAPTARPIIVITSNSERRLPDPFLRRCVIHQIALDLSVIPAILAGRLAEIGDIDSEFISAAASFWLKLGTLGLSRKPTIDEYWRWLTLAVQYGQLPKGEIIGALRNSDPSAELLPFISTLLSQQDIARVIGA